MPSLTARMTPQSAYMVSPQTTVVERLTRVGKDQMSYVFSVTDPTFYTRSWTGESRLDLTQDRVMESACHEGNYSLPNALQGTRVQEARAVER